MTGVTTKANPNKISEGGVGVDVSIDAGDGSSGDDRQPAPFAVRSPSPSPSLIPSANDDDGHPPTEEGATAPATTATATNTNAGANADAHVDADAAETTAAQQEMDERSGFSPYARPSPGSSSTAAAASPAAAASSAPSHPSRTSTARSTPGAHHVPGLTSLRRQDNLELLPPPPGQSAEGSGGGAPAMGGLWDGVPTVTTATLVVENDEDGRADDGARVDRDGAASGDVENGVLMSNDEAALVAMHHQQAVVRAEAVPLDGCCHLTLCGRRAACDCPSCLSDKTERGRSRRAWLLLGSATLLVVAIAIGVLAGVNTNRQREQQQQQQAGEAESTAPESPGNNQNVTPAPLVQWRQLGLDIDGTVEGGNFGWSVALSSNGTRFVAGSFLGGTLAGSIRVYEYSALDKAGGDGDEQLRGANAGWAPMGDNARMVGDSPGNRMGWAVSMSGDGTVVAGSAVRSGTDNFTENGLVRVYQYSEYKEFEEEAGGRVAAGKWSRLGQDIAGDKNGEWFGYTVSLSSDGTRLAAGSLKSSGWTSPNNGTGTAEAALEAGRVRVFQLVEAAAEGEGEGKGESNSGWVQMGTSIIGRSAKDWGAFASLSGDGNVVAVGAVQPTSTGYVQMLKWDPNAQQEGTQQGQHRATGDWVQMGQDLLGRNTGDWFGYALSLSHDGQRVAVGAINHAGGGKSNSGQVRVYEYKDDEEEREEEGAGGSKNGEWTQLGQDINGEAASDASGYAVSLSSDGATVAIGARFNGEADGGHARIFVLKGSNSETLKWAQLGADIDGETDGDHSGSAVALSANGRTVAIGARYNNAGSNVTNAGHVRVYSYPS